MYLPIQHKYLSSISKTYVREIAYKFWHRLKSAGGRKFSEAYCSVKVSYGFNGSHCLKTYGREWLRKTLGFPVESTYGLHMYTHIWIHTCTMRKRGSKLFYLYFRSFILVIYLVKMWEQSQLTHLQLFTNELYYILVLYLNKKLN